MSFYIELRIMAQPKIAKFLRIVKSLASNVS